MADLGPGEAAMTAAGPGDAAVAPTVSRRFGDCTIVNPFLAGDGA